jgi:hypothetical protein
MNEYTDTKIIECNRLHSEEALSNNNENFALWTNNLTDVITLEAGDKVSVHGAMISERGAGQSSSIEIKGQTLGFTQTFTDITNLSGINASSDLPSQFEELKVNLSNPTIDVRDDEAYFKMGYYINMNAHNYIQLPRRWWWNKTRTANNFNDYDDRFLYGMALCDPFFNDGYGLFDDYYQLSGNAGDGLGSKDKNGSLTKVKNDNSRFTIMVRDNTYYSESSASGNFPNEFLRDPENAIYYPYSELKKIHVQKGFNSPEFIAEDITRQLQQVVKETTYQKRNETDLTQNSHRPGFPAVISKTFETETYKVFNCAGFYGVANNLSNNNDAKDSYEYYINGSTHNGSTNNNGSGFEYIKNYHIVGCKRPELYTTGRLLNRDQNSAYKGIEGTTLKHNFNGLNNINNNSIGLETSVRYNETRVNEWRDFIRAQEKYPEVFNIFSDSRTPYDDGDTIDNCRWWHMNRLRNASMYLDDGTGESRGSQLGWGGYRVPTQWNASGQQLMSVIVPFKYDPDQRETFYDNPDESLDQRSYGCFGKSSGGYIVVYPTETNGCGSTLFDMLFEGSQFGGDIEATRRCGYDMHFSAVGNAWCLPYSGFAQFPISNDTRAIPYFDYEIARNNGRPLTTYKIRTMDLKTQLYLGADAPRLNWDGTNFSISDLHTAMNRGNNFASNNPYTDAQVLDTESFDDVVYKINPVELGEDWTPARMPYDTGEINITITKNASDHTYKSKVMNQNLEPWTIYDSLCGINIEDFALTEKQWSGTLWDLLGFSYKQFHSETNNRLKRIDYTNVNDLSVITTNAEINEGDTKLYSQNLFGAPMLKNMIPLIATMKDKNNTERNVYNAPIVQKTQSIKIVADNLPTRMIRGYYTIRSNIMEETPFIGGKKNNVTMPIVSIVDKINGDGDFYFQQESSLQFTITKPLRLASIRCSVHDPDGSYANVSEQSTLLFKIQKDRRNTFNVAQELLQEEQGQQPQ